MNASLCFSNAKKFLLEIRRIEQEQENDYNLKNENKKTVGSKTLDSGRQLANNQACSATVALLKVWNLRSKILEFLPVFCLDFIYKFISVYK